MDHWDNMTLMSNRIFSCLLASTAFGDLPNTSVNPTRKAGPALSAGVTNTLIPIRLGRWPSPPTVSDRLPRQLCSHPYLAAGSAASPASRWTQKLADPPWLLSPLGLVSAGESERSSTNNSKVTPLFLKFLLKHSPLPIKKKIAWLRLHAILLSVAPSHPVKAEHVSVPSLCFGRQM